jgi:hypothetical protein
VRLPDGGRWDLAVGAEWFSLTADGGVLRVRAGRDPVAELAVRLQADGLLDLMIGRTASAEALAQSEVEGNRVRARQVLAALAGALA